MKNSIILLCLVISAFGYSQDEDVDSTKTKKAKGTMYIGFAGNGNDASNLNRKLKQANLPKLGSFIPEFTVGLNIMGEKYSGDIEVGFLSQTPEKGENELQYRGINTRLRFHYNLVNEKKVALTTGLSLAYLGSTYDIYSRNNTIDLNNLEPNDNNGHVNFNNQMLYFGPSISFYAFRDKWFALRFNAGYEFGLTRGRYRSDFGSILNNTNESGSNRFVFGLTLL
jgi:hypothetical protein